jgi:hypothetical protein
MYRFLKKLFLFPLKNLPFWLVIFPVFLSGCENEVPIPPLPETKPKLVLYALISPETDGLQLSVTRTIPLKTTGNPIQPDVVTDATVLFSDSRDTIRIPFNPVLQLYVVPHYAVQPGTTYQLSVTAPGGFSAKAQCTVPAKINRSLTAAIDSGITVAGTSGKIYALELNWDDLAGSGDFYKTDAKLVTRNSNGAADPKFEISMVGTPLARDYLADGRHWQRRSEFLPTEDLALTGDKPDSVYAYLLTTDQPYYDFHNSLYKFRNTTIGVGKISDPVSIYTNVKGGFGIFAAYRTYVVSLKF